MKTMNFVAVVLATSLLGACASPRIMPGATQEEWVSMSAQEREVEAKRVMQMASAYEEWWAKVGKPLFDKHQPVMFGPEGSNATMQWVVLPGEHDAVIVNMLHNPLGVDGQTTASTYVALADKQGNILSMKGAGGVIAPNKIIANVTAEEDFRRLVTRGVFQVGAAASNGLLGQIYRTERGCDGDGCGNGGNITLTNVGGVSSAGSSAQSHSATSADISLGGACSTCVPLQ